MSTLRYSGLYIGTEVTFTTPSPQKWVVEEKLTEKVHQMTRDGPPFAVFKYLCHSPTDSNKKAFMRTYFQIPIAGTESQRPEVRQQQAAPPRKNRELDALKDLRLRQCPVVPTLLAYKEEKQDNDSLVPDGYITYILWDKVPGKSLDQDQFWDPKSAPLREVVRAKFHNVWEELRGYGWEPVVPGLQNIIYDESTETMHIAGFRNPVPLDPEEKFTDRTFSGWGLAIPPDDADWEEDSTKWAW
ncbi:hypothetical protein N7449_007275 [Penicillium cf. viridicatum]|uniref:Uncharacterized protein n=1 Tax=Penicillium cf. viridicatum TaxID=2972119 RepID=A0A9W9MBC2_9EURO|nr:hypothetical protein N7449_007275 [Penicillium cf. viridicatum]